MWPGCGVAPVTGIDAVTVAIDARSSIGMGVKVGSGTGDEVRAGAGADVAVSISIRVGVIGVAGVAEAKTATIGWGVSVDPELVVAEYVTEVGGAGFPQPVAKTAVSMNNENVRTIRPIQSL